MSTDTDIPVEYADISIAEDGDVLVMIPKVDMVAGDQVHIVFKGKDMIIAQDNKIYADIKNVKSIEHIRKAPVVLVMEADKAGYMRLHEEVSVVFK